MQEAAKNLLLFASLTCGVIAYALLLGAQKAWMQQLLGKFALMLILFLVFLVEAIFCFVTFLQ